MSYPITDIDGIDAEMAAILRSVGIRTTEKLLDAAKSARERKLLAVRTGLSEKLLLGWANAADRMRIQGMGKEYAALLPAVGVDTVKELKYRNPGRLAKAMAEANSQRKLVRFLPSEKAIVRWIEEAKKLPPKISY
jgi:predicted RecB family nuclease